MSNHNYQLLFDFQLLNKEKQEPLKCQIEFQDQQKMVILPTSTSIFFNEIYNKQDIYLSFYKESSKQILYNTSIMIPLAVKNEFVIKETQQFDKYTLSYTITIMQQSPTKSTKKKQQTISTTQHSASKQSNSSKLTPRQLKTNVSNSYKSPFSDDEQQLNKSSTMIDHSGVRGTHSLQSQIYTQEEAIKNLEYQLASTQDETIRSLKKQQGEAQNQIISLKSEIGQYKDQIKALNSQNNQQNLIIQTKNQDMHETKRILDLEIQQKNKYQKDREQAQTKIKEYEKQIISLKKEIVTLTHMNKTLEVENQKFRDNLEQEKQQKYLLQQQLKHKLVYIDELSNQEERHKNQIKQFEILNQKADQVIEKQHQEINELNQKINQQFDQVEQLLKTQDLNNNQVTQLKNLIRGMKETRAAYIPMHGDPLDEALADFINSVNDPERLIKMILREGNGNYRIGSRKVYLKTEKGKVYVKLGGGYIGIEEYLDLENQNASDKLNKSQYSSTPKNRSLTPTRVKSQIQQ